MGTEVVVERLVVVRNRERVRETEAKEFLLVTSPAEEPATADRVAGERRCQKTRQDQRDGECRSKG